MTGLDPRRAFLSRLEAPFRERAPTCRLDYEPAPPFPGVALMARVEGRLAVVQYGDSAEIEAHRERWREHRRV